MLAFRSTVLGGLIGFLGTYGAAIVVAPEVSYETVLSYMVGFCALGAVLGFALGKRAAATKKHERR